MKNFFYACTVKYPDNKFISWVATVSENENIIGRFDGKDTFGGEVIIAHPCFTKKQAFEIVDAWNRTYISDGRFKQF